VIKLKKKRRSYYIMIIRKSKKTDLCELMPIFDEARGTIAKLGIDQWQDGYPSREVITQDIDFERSYAVVKNGKVCATFVLIFGGDPTYDIIDGGDWLTGNDSKAYVAIHRVAISVSERGSGIAGRIISFAKDMALMKGERSLRIDTHEGNVVMRRMLEKNGFTYCGIIYLESGAERVAYELPVI